MLTPVRIPAILRTRADLRLHACVLLWFCGLGYGDAEAVTRWILADVGS